MRRSDNLECVNQFQVDAGGRVVVVESFSLGGDALQGTRILVVATVYQAHVLAFVQLGVSAWSFLLDGLFESEFVLILREYAGKAHGLVGHLGLLHHELQGGIFNIYLIHFIKYPLFMIPPRYGRLSKDNDANVR